MDLQNKTPEDLANLVQVSEDKETLRAVADHVGVTYSGNTGIDTLKNKVLAEIILKEKPDAVVIVDDEPQDDEPKEDAPDRPDPVLMAALNKHQREKMNKPAARPASKLPDLSVLITMNEREPGISEPLRRAIVRSKALRLIRCRVTNLDPQDAAVPGMLLTVYNKYTGKVSKLIPFGEENENGYHVPQVLIDDLKARTFNMRKEKKRIGSSFGVKEYTTVEMRKFSIEYLDSLDQDDLDSLANDQKARGAIDQTI